MIPPRLWVCLILSGKTLDPLQVSNILKLKPDYAHKPHKTEQGKEISGYWQLNSSLAETESLENHILDILKKLASMREELKKILATCDSHFYASVEYSTLLTDGIVISSRVMSLLSSLGTKIELHQWKEKPFDVSGIE